MGWHRTACALLAVGCALVAPAVAAADTIDLAPNWQVQSSASVSDPGAGLSQPGFSTAGWLPVHTNDANAVGGEVAAQLQNTPPDAPCGANNIFYGENITTCQGAQPGAHSAPNAPYNVPWWFRTEFTPGLTAGQSAPPAGRGGTGQAGPSGNGGSGAARGPGPASGPQATVAITQS